MSDNQTIIQRADNALANFASNGGVLLPEQSNAFIDLLVVEPTIIKQARTVRMNSPTMYINKIVMGNRILKAAPQGTAPYAGDSSAAENNRWLLKSDRSEVTTSKIQLNTYEVMAEVHLPYETLEDNIEGAGLEDHIMRLIAQRTARDVEDWCLNADTTLAGSDAFLGLRDGLLKTATSNVVNNASAGCTPDLFQAGMLAIPQQYLRDYTQLKHIVPTADTIKYRGNVARRATGYGDSSLTGDGQLMVYGIGVEAAPLMPAHTGIFTYPKNIIFGIHRNIQIETDKDIRAREIIIVLTMRIDVVWDNVDAVVKYTNI